MRILLLMIPISIVLLGIAIWAFRYHLRHAQCNQLSAGKSSGQGVSGQMVD